MDESPESGAGGRENVNITNITGTIQGPVFMGNESVSFGGAAGGGGREVFSSTPFNESVPPLKPSATEISPDDGVITVGGVTFEYSKYTVREAMKVALSYKVDMSESPEGLIAASSFLACAPKFHGRQQVRICLPTFCSTQKSVAASVYRKDEEGRWQFVDETLLEDDRKIFVSVPEISNMAAFIPKERIADVEYSIACFLFNNADGRFVMGFCLDDEAIKAAFCHRITANGFTETVHIPDVLQTRLGDEIAFKISPGQNMTNTKMTVDENFVSRPEGIMSQCTLDKDAEDPQYFIEHYRNGKEIDDYVYGVKSEKSKNEGVKGGIRFLGRAKVGNVISSVNNVEIDQSTYQDEDGATRENDRVHYTGCDGGNDKEPATCQEKSDCGVKYGRDGTPRKVGGIVFEGDAKIGNVVHNARNVKINQSNRSCRAKKSSAGTKKSAVERVVAARQPEHEDETAVSVPATVDIEVESQPISRNCEKKAEEDKAVQEGGDVEAKARPIWPNCEKQVNEDGATVGGEGTVEDKALPIWKDCEKQAQQEREEGRAETDTSKQTPSDQHEERAAGKNEALPTYSDESSEDSDSEMQSGGISSGAPEIDLKRSERRARQRKVKSSTKPPKIKAVVVPDDEPPKESEKDQPSQSFDACHLIMIAIIGVLLYVIVMLRGEEGSS